ncbi:hypothetical protein EV191_12315 [Tamaricihabitans halophyticus]|uniref:Xaa-Pro dipeptidyl-peptidase C-terminal domain-containing protein n=1 Tax=Tamaricihabitans halophyticus TaxID=1262583 RepID=A0A4V2SRD5_9PSEU|nr:CocE/NonD family hydrolase [Tamaricihabitans halophyticus]TCP42616.1 hypothetical protein EV191_12315 [Tamaricihabitans halophyticus]
MHGDVNGYTRSEARDGMLVDWQVPIPMDDGLELRADIFRPQEQGRHPVILSYGPYGKGSPFQLAYPSYWAAMVEEFPEITLDSSGAYQNYEVVDPQRWVPDGYAIVRVDSRGAGCSPGILDVLSTRETMDLHDCIEWASEQPWSTGRVGLCGISYYTIIGWLVAGTQPPSLSAMVAWEGVADLYRDACYHGGIPSRFAELWYPGEVLPVQYGQGERSFHNPHTGQSAAGPVTLPEDELALNRTEVAAEISARPLEDSWYTTRSAEWSKIRVPFLSAANWGGQGLHSRGNFEAFMNATAPQKWLEVHGLEHWTLFYTDYGISLQKRFLDHFLKGEDNGWDNEPPVRLQVRHVDGSTFERHETEWPIERTQWTDLYLECQGKSLTNQPAAKTGSVNFDAPGRGITFWSPPFEQDTEITGPMAATLFVSSSTSDADIFTVVHVVRPDGTEVVLRGSLDEYTPIAQGWLRASHRELDDQRSLPYRPFHTHRTPAPLTPGKIYELAVEIWPTSIIVPRGYRIACTIRSTDYEYTERLDELASEPPYPGAGCGPCLHGTPLDRGTEIARAQVSVHSGPRNQSKLIVPIVPATR